ncbi:LamB/YcsF family protein [Lysinibacillus xylanilyticus]|uniref:LamB/YcsF family protein n=1 Tax=Lysinibacillus xylanilyticus TaxID=582475 RepID=UPI003CFF0AC1
MIDFPTTTILHLEKALHNAWGMFTTFLRYKLEERGEKTSCWPKADSGRNYAEVMSVQQKKIKISAQTLCIHGDGPLALDYAKKVYKFRCQME